MKFIKHATELIYRTMYSSQTFRYFFLYVKNSHYRFFRGRIQTDIHPDGNIGDYGKVSISSTCHF